MTTVATRCHSLEVSLSAAMRSLLEPTAELSLSQMPPTQSQPHMQCSDELRHIVTLLTDLLSLIDATVPLALVDRVSKVLLHTSQDSTYSHNIYCTPTTHTAILALVHTHRLAAVFVANNDLLFVLLESIGHLAMLLRYREQKALEHFVEDLFDLVSDLFTIVSHVAAQTQPHQSSPSPSPASIVKLEPNVNGSATATKLFPVEVASCMRSCRNASCLRCQSRSSQSCTCRAPCRAFQPFHSLLPCQCQALSQPQSLSLDTHNGEHPLFVTVSSASMCLSLLASNLRLLAKLHPLIVCHDSSQSMSLSAASSLGALVTFAASQFDSRIASENVKKIWTEISAISLSLLTSLLPSLSPSPSLSVSLSLPLLSRLTETITSLWHIRADSITQWLLIDQPNVNSRLSEAKRGWRRCMAFIHARSISELVPHVVQHVSLMQAIRRSSPQTFEQQFTALLAAVCESQPLQSLRPQLTALGHLLPSLLLHSHHLPLQVCHLSLFFQSILAVPAVRFSLHALLPVIHEPIPAASTVIVDCFRLAMALTLDDPREIDSLLTPPATLNRSRLSPSATPLTARSKNRQLDYSEGMEQPTPKRRRMEDAAPVFEPMHIDGIVIDSIETNHTASDSHINSPSQNDSAAASHPVSVKCATQHYFHSLFYQLLQALDTFNPASLSQAELKYRYIYVDTMARIFLPTLGLAVNLNVEHHDEKKLSLIDTTLRHLSVFMRVTVKLVESKTGHPAPTPETRSLADDLLARQLSLCEEILRYLPVSVFAGLRDDVTSVLQCVMAMIPPKLPSRPIPSQLQHQSQSLPSQSSASLFVSALHLVAVMPMSELCIEPSTLRRAMHCALHEVRAAALYALLVSTAHQCQSREVRERVLTSYWPVIVELANDADVDVRHAVSLVTGKLCCLQCSPHTTFTQSRDRPFSAAVRLIEQARANSQSGQSLVDPLSFHFDRRLHSSATPSTLGRFVDDIAAIQCEICDGQRSANNADSSLSFSLHLAQITARILSQRSDDFRARESRRSMATSFFRCLRHVRLMELLHRPSLNEPRMQDAIISASQVPYGRFEDRSDRFVVDSDRALNPIAHRVLDLLVDSDESVRDVVANSFSLLLDDPELEASVSDGQRTPVIASCSGPLLALFCAVKSSSSSALPSMVTTDGGTLNIFLACMEQKENAGYCIGTLIETIAAIYMRVTNSGQLLLLWWLIQQLNHLEVHVRVLASSAIKRVAQSLHQSPSELLASHGEELYSLLLHFVVEQDKSTLIDEICVLLLAPQSSADLISQALAAVLPALVMESVTEQSRVLAALVKISGFGMKDLLSSSLHRILHQLLLSPEAHDKQNFSVFAANAQRFLSENLGFGSNQSFGQIVFLTGKQLLRDFIRTYSKLSTDGSATAADGDADTQARIEELDKLVYLTASAIVEPKLFDELMDRPVDYDALSERLQPQFLMIIDELKKPLVGKLATANERESALESFAHLLRMVNSRLGSFVPKIVSLLKSMLQTGSTENVPVRARTLRLKVMKVWRRFLESLGMARIGEYLSPIVLTLVKYVKEDTGDSDPLDVELSRSVVSTLQWLLVEHREDLKEWFADIPAIPLYTSLAAIRASLSSDAADLPLLDRLRQLMRLLKHDSSEVRIGTIEQLRDCLIDRRHQFDALTLEGEYGELVTQLIPLLLTKCNDPERDVKIIAAECLGELGAVDPGQLNVDALSDRPERHTDDASFARHVIESMLVPVLKMANTPLINDIAMFAIQEILKTVQCSGEAVVALARGIEQAKGVERQINRVKIKYKEKEVAAAEFWLIFPREVRDLIEPCATSEYSITINRQDSRELPSAPPAMAMPTLAPVSTSRRQMSDDDTPILRQRPLGLEYSPDTAFGHPHATQSPIPPLPRGATRPSEKHEPAAQRFRKWLLKWTRESIEQTRGPRQQIFAACRGIALRDETVARKLLPYLIDNILMYGDASQTLSVCNEIQQVLSRSSTIGAHANTEAADSNTNASQSHTSSSSSRQAQDIADQQASQVIFEVIDLIVSWLHDEATIAYRLQGHSSSSPSGSSNNGQRQTALITEQQPLWPIQSTASRPLRSMTDRKAILDSIPKQLLALAAYKCQAYTRALKYEESYLREQRENHRKVQNHVRQQQRAPQRSTRKSTVNDSGTATELEPRPDIGQLTSGLADGLTPPDLRFLQRLYASMDEPDGMQGIASLRSTTSLDEQIRDYRALGQWSDALTCYDQALATATPAQLHDYHTGYLDCLLQLGRWSECITYVNGVSNKHPALTQKMSAYGVQAAWRLNDWRTLKSFMANEPKTNFQVRLASLLLALHENDHEAYNIALHRARSEVMFDLSTASYESYQRAYVFCAQLHCLQEIEQIKRASHDPRSMESLIEHWNLRLQRTIPAFKVREPILSLRRTLYQKFNVREEIGHSWLTLAVEARRSGQWETSSAALFRASSFSVEGVPIERAKLIKARGQQHEALRFLDDEFAKLRKQFDGSYHSASGNTSTSWTAMGASQFQSSNQSPSSALVSSTSPSSTVRLSPVLANMSLVLGKWHRELENRNFQEIQKFLVEASQSRAEWEKARYRLAQFYNDMARQMIKQKEQEYRERLTTTAVRQQRSDGDGAAEDVLELKPIAEKLLRATVLHFVETLALGHRYLFQCLPKLLTLYFDQTELTAAREFANYSKVHKKVKRARPTGGSKDGENKARTMEKFTAIEDYVGQGGVMDSVHLAMKQAVEKIAPYKWFTALSQLLSRLGHSNIFTLAIILQILETVLYNHHAQAVWSIAPVKKSKDKARRPLIDCLLKRVLERWESAKTDTARLYTKELGAAIRVLEALNVVCEPDDHQKSGIISIKQNYRMLPVSLDSIARVLVPIQAALTVSLPNTNANTSTTDAAASTSRAAGSKAQSIDRAHQPFASHLVTIASFDDQLVVLPSKEKPKKLTMLGSDGKCYMFLCKKEGKSDMRKTSRVMELNGVINRLLKKNNDTRTRHLQLRTFAALPLTEENGLIEWVPNTSAFRNLVKSLHDRLGIHTDNKELRDMYVPVQEYRRDVKRREEERHVRGHSFRKTRDEKTTDLATELELKLYRHQLARYPPVFHQWLLQAFPDPTSWFQSRLTYSHSVAVWSMVGFVIGLGDRHGENILIDTSNGECVHVDFDCLFGKGLKLETPEKVPFRLTQNLIDGMGLAGIEGVYRRCCELTMAVMRQHRETLQSVLHTFLHDPLLDWRQASADRPPPHSVGAVLTRQEQRERGVAAADNDVTRTTANEKLQEVSQKLSGVVNPHAKSESAALGLHALSVNGQVDALIRDATSEQLLAQMYVGWMAWC